MSTSLDQALFTSKFSSPAQLGMQHMFSTKRLKEKVIQLFYFPAQWELSSALRNVCKCVTNVQQKDSGWSHFIHCLLLFFVAQCFVNPPGYGDVFIREYIFENGVPQK